eukprot:TRINITY_DN32762_c0_g1_i6.p3 TRINITY_DN32762_c0_g1~~TRINITY_DN32762_c0_g1_i6.p3  ORF type:complete len:146 (+),score=3.19 TRINITY_DN32762_c0_g1_i6:459-896(+)
MFFSNKFFQQSQFQDIIFIMLRKFHVKDDQKKSSKNAFQIPFKKLIQYVSQNFSRVTKKQQILLENQYQGYQQTTNFINLKKKKKKKMFPQFSQFLSKIIFYTVLLSFTELRFNENCDIYTVCVVKKKTIVHKKKKKKKIGRAHD